MSVAAPIPKHIFHSRPHSPKEVVVLVQENFSVYAVVLIVPNKPQGVLRRVTLTIEILRLEWFNHLVGI
jgi:hypothetical protein